MPGDLAAELKLSPTPVREAVAWLAGEGLVESQRGAEGGYRVQRLSRGAVEDLYAMQDLLLSRTGLGHESPVWPQGSARSEVEHALGAVHQGADVVRATEVLFGGAVSALRNRVVWQAQVRLADRLALVRRIEARLYPDLPNELMGMALAYDAGRAEWRQALAVWAARRATRLAQIVDQLDPPPGLPDILAV